MEGSWLALAELQLVFGAVLAFGFWELYSLRRDRKQAEESHRGDPARSDPPGNG